MVALPGAAPRRLAPADRGLLSVRPPRLCSWTAHPSASSCPYTGPAMLPLPRTIARRSVRYARTIRVARDAHRSTGGVGMEHQLSPGAALRRYRLAAGISQEALAEHAGLSVEAIGAIERGQRRPRVATLRALGAALSLSQPQIGALESTLRRTGRPRTAPPPPGLPVYSTALVGRTHDLAVIGYLLRVAGVRLLTLSGVGGVGKTRL